jgi:hypothetical protein
MLQAARASHGLLIAVKSAFEKWERCDPHQRSFRE